ncbi:MULTISPECIES: hypothetical protein [unclassified Microbacterium]|uniref:hypothetical protein n=1 Tax=unclassified Microbacterium TaxID=2609290 RepID=UPI00160535B1|nr:MULTISPECIES: hypothetical protein [unclassified Microbacterium]QNA91561.1 hypothetical protein G4G29_02275 [Microbacterium sp. Se63.02b]QYM64736.1 hypothetical protein K1X59_02280 [Microbacterium sp. Se5.02b]
MRLQDVDRSGSGELMRIFDSVGEAIRNIRSGSSRAGIIALILVLTSTALLAVDAATIGALQERAGQVRSQAGAIRVLVADHAIDPTACASLAELKSIADAGPIWPLDSLQLLALPLVEVPVFELSTGAARMLDFPRIRPGGTYIPESLAERWHAREGSRLETSDGVMVVDGVYRYSEDDGRDPRLANAIVVIGEDSERASECWFSVWPPSNVADQYAYGTITSSGPEGSAPQIAPLNPAVGQRFDFTREYTTRATALAAAGVVVLFGVLAFSFTARRRMEVAGNLHAGARRRHVLAGIAIETVIWAVATAIATFVLARLTARFLLREALAGYETSLAMTLVIATGAAVIGAVIPVILTREDRLFVLFKSRA